MSPPLGLAVFDMDRTLHDGRVIQALGRGLGFFEEAMRVIAEREAGLAGVEEVTVAVARFLEGVRVEDFDRCVAGIPTTPGAPKAVARLLEAGVAVALCSESYTRAAHPLARRLGIPLLAANVLAERGGAFTGELLPWGPALGLGPSGRVLDKREAVPLLAAKAGVPLARTALVGDGDPDAEAMPLVGLGIAFQGTPRARKAARHQLEGSLAPAADLILDWLRAAPPRP